MLSRGDNSVKQYPQHSEEQQHDEEDLPVHSGNGHIFGAAADQRAAQDQDVDADDAREEPAATVVGPLHDCLHMVNRLHDRSLTRKW